MRFGLWNRFPSPAEALDADQGRFIGFVRLIGARKSAQANVNLYDPGLIAAMEKAGVFSKK
jgi:hypothetical protein